MSHAFSVVRNLCLVAALGVACSAACKRKSESDADPMLKWKRLDEIPTFAIRLSPDSRESLLRSPRSFVEADFEHGGVTLARVGVRLKGHRSMRKLTDKPALKIRFDKFVKGQKFKGIKRLTLNNMIEDPTLLREVLGYRLYRELGVPAPAAFYARLTIDGEDYGLYAVIETVDKQFLKARFADASGGLYEGEYGCDVYPDDVSGFDRDSGDEKDGRADLGALAAAAAGDPAALFADDGPLHMKSFLAYLAVSAFIGDFDGYRHAHNYRIYHEPTLNKWYFVPWGIDRAFKQQLSIYESYGLLARRCFDDAACRARYVRVQRDVVAAFERLNLDEGAAALAAFIEPVLRDDAKKRKSSRINKARKQLLEFLVERPKSIATETTCIAQDGTEVDADGDGHSCRDCNDADASVHPGATDVCGDAVDNDCSGHIDDNPTCDSCERVTTGARTYALCNFPRPWTAAQSYCRGMGGTLAVIESAEANRAVAEVAARLEKGRWWLSHNDRATEGAFEGARPSTFVNWGKGEPDNHTCNQDCAVLDTTKKATWHDTHCGQPLPFVCELPPASPKSSGASRAR